jgi:hypothetical protein
MLEESKALNAIYKSVQQKLYTIDWNEEVQFVNEYRQTNVNALKAAIKLLEEGDAAKALEDELWKVDLCWYAYDFDKETVDYFAQQVLGKDAKNSWGAGYITDCADLHGTIRSLQSKQEDKDPDLTAEIAALKAELEKQQKALDDVLTKATADVEAITKAIVEAGEPRSA